MVLPPHLEKIRDRLAENIHELWGMNKIELGWTFGKVYVWVAGWAGGLDCLITCKGSSETQMTWKPHGAQTRCFFLTLIQLALHPASLPWGLSSCSQENWGVQLCTDRPRSPSPSYSQTLGFFFREYRVQSSLRALTPPLPFQKSHPLCLGSEKRLIHYCGSGFV